MSQALRSLQPLTWPQRASRLSLLAGALLLGACVSPPQAEPPTRTEAPVWFAPLPHGGQTDRLAAWWQDFDDPLLARLIDQAQAAHPGLAQAAARIAQARAQAEAASGARWPALDARGGLTRSRSELPPAAGAQTTASATLDAGWEIDLFGGIAQGARAAQARAQASADQWHDARISLAAEVASTYVGLRACEAVLAVFEQDAASLGQTAELTRQKVKVGFDAPANAALAEASAAEAANRVVAQRAECDVAVKQLVALTVQPEGRLREQMAARRGALPRPQALRVAQVPAALLAQRPDISAAARAVAAASADVGVAQADRYPRLSLSGTIGLGAVRAAGQTVDGSTWSFGPGLVIPLFDGGRRQAAVDAAQARYDEAVAAYRERTLSAVREVEEALVRLDAAERREADAVRAAQGFAEFFAAAQTQWQVGTGSLLDLEQARRTALSASAGLIQVQRERVAAWITLYKAMGGGWQSTDPTPVAAASMRAPIGSAPPHSPTAR